MADLCSPPTLGIWDHYRSVFPSDTEPTAEEDVHILPHKPSFGSMGPLRFQLNILPLGLHPRGSKYLHPPNVHPLRALWSLFGGILGSLEGSFGGCWYI